MEYAHQYPIRRRWATGEPGGFSRLDNIRHKAHGMLGLGRIAMSQTNNLKKIGMITSGLQQRRLSSLSDKMPAVRRRRSPSSPASIRPSGTVRRKLDFSPVTPKVTGLRYPMTPATPFSVKKAMKMYKSTQKIKSRGGTGYVVRSRSRWGAVASKSKGRFAKPSRRKRNVFERVGKYGVQQVRETGAVVGGSTGNAVFLMHACWKAYNLRWTISMLLAKQLAKAANLDFTSGDQPICPTGSGLKYNFIIAYKQYPAQANVTTWSYAATDLTAWGTLIQNIFDNVVNQTAAAVPPSPQFSFEYLQVTSTSITDGVTARTFDYKQIDLRSATMELYCKSSLKIQNRTVNTANTDDQAVDNVPIYGKSYQGKGNCLSMLEQASGVPIEKYYLSAEDNNACVAYTTFPANAVYSEPPGYDLVRRVGSIGKAHLDPGEVKTSTITDYRRIGLNTLYRMTCRAYQTTGNSQQLPLTLGKYRAFHMEKMIQAVATDAANYVKVAFEVDEKIAANMKAKTLSKSAPFVWNNPS